MTAPTPASELETLAICERILGYLQTKRWSIAFAESLTAGYACGTLARVSGISAVLRGGIVAYEKAHLASLAKIFIPKFDGLPKEVVRIIVSFWAHAGYY